MSIAKTMDINEVIKYLPHRYPFLLIDRVLSYEPGNQICALKNVTINEPFFTGHFPKHPVMPGVLVIEAMAQAAAILSFVTVGGEIDENSIVYFVGIDNARFKRPVTPGDALQLKVSLTRRIRGIWKFQAAAYVDDFLVAEAELMCTARDIPA
jgi:3-hydroxyacyl-[acyl-carrier-protein] dehydratase